MTMGRGKRSAMLAREIRLGTSPLRTASIAIVIFLCGCSTGQGDGPEALGRVEIALMNVPSDVLCVQVIAAGSRAISSLFTVTPGGSTTFTMPGVPPGSVTFSGGAFPNACATITPATVPTWIADVKTVTIVAGATTSV